MNNAVYKQFLPTQQIELLRGGKEFFDRFLEIIRSAQREILLQTYILDADVTGISIITALYEAANRGVKIYLMLDAFGSSNLPKNLIQSIQEHGIEFRWFKPIITISNMELGRRLHHKVLVVDNEFGVVSGMNLADRYNDTKNSPAWLDFGVVVKGPPAELLRQRCQEVWQNPFPQLSVKNLQQKSIQFPQAHHSMVKVNVNDWLRGRTEIIKSYHRVLDVAEKSVILLGSYFLPGRRLRKRIRQATQRGVDVKVILTHVSDVRFAKGASENLYSWLFQNKVRIFEWKPSVLHGKIAVMDDYWTTVGSFNINFLSAFESIELNLEIVDEKLNQNLRDTLDGIIKNECVEVDSELHNKSRTFFKKLSNRWSYFIFRNSMRLLFLFSRKQQQP